MRSIRFLVIVIWPCVGWLACDSSHPGEPDSGGEVDGAVREDSGGLSDSGGMRDGSVVPDAGPADAGPEPCAEEGRTRVTACGTRCGMGSQLCTGGLWEPNGPCLDEGECSAGALEMRATAMCGEETRLCGGACTWGAWNVTTVDGECEPATTRTDEADCGTGRMRAQTCSAGCAWESTRPCTDLCGDSPRTSPADAEEVCVPAGPFIRGAMGVVGVATPVREVTLSAYYIDRYLVTNRRYAECVAAGACTEPVDDGLVSYSDATRTRFPVQMVSWEQARQFCEWDGRRLPTEAQWEKAARGPSPRENLYPWDGDTWRCDLLYTYACGLPSPGARLYALIRDEFDAVPGSRSYYGMEMVLAGGIEWMSDWYATDYYADDASLVDPSGAATGVRRAARSQPREYGTAFHSIPARVSGSPAYGMTYSVIRCARSVPSM